MSVVQFRKILLIKPSSLGDCIHALPVLNALKKHLPQAEIFWLINSQYADLLANHQALGGLILFPRSFFRLRHLGPSTARETYRLWRRLRAERFDLTIDLQGLFRSGMMSLASGARVRLGLSDARELAGVFYTHHVRLKPKDIHAVDRYLRVLDALGISPSRPDFSLGVDLPAVSRVRAMLARSGLADPEKFILVVPGARWQSKRWPAERFVAVIDRLNEELSLPSVLAGSADEVQLCQHVAELARSRPLNLTGQTSLAQLMAVMSISRLVLGHDSGTIHLAHALGKPLVCIVGPTDPQRSGPYARADSIVTAEVPCAPCRRTVCSDNKCMAMISPEDVFTKVQAGLSANPSDRTQP